MPLLSIDITASYAKFQDAMSAIERSAKRSAGNLQTAFHSVNGVLAGLGVTVSAGALAALVKSSIDAADHLNDLSKKTGIAVETLGGIGFAAEQAGSNLDGAGKALGKLNLAIAGAGAGNKEFSEAFRVMGLNILDSNNQIKTADKMLLEIAGKFESYRGGPREAALANSIFAKSYQDVLPLLKDGGKALQDNLDYYNRYAKVSTALAKDADQFNDQLTKIGLLSKAAGNQIASELLPTMSQITAKMISAKESADGFSAAAKTIGTAFKGITIAGAGAVAVVGQLGDHLGAMFAAQGRLADLDLDGAANVFKEYGNESKKRLAEYLKFVDQVTSGAVADTGPVLSKGGASGDWEDAPALNGDNATKMASRALADRLQRFERASDQERQIFAARNDMLQEFYKQDLLSIEDYYSAKDAAAKEALQAQQANINKEIALLRKSVPKDDPLAVAENNSKIKDLQDKSAQLEADYNTQTTKSILEKISATKDFGREIAEVNSQFQEMQGLLEKTAARRFDTEHAVVSNRLTTQRQAAVDAGDTDKVAQIDQARQQLDMMRAAATAQGRINELLIEESRIQTDLEIATERADMAAENGSISQIEALKRISEARRQAGADLQAAAKAFADAAAASPDKSLEDQAKRFQLAADKMVASADLVRDKMQGVFANGFESFFDKLMSGTVSLKDAFKSLFNDIAADMAKLAIKNISKDLFSTSGTFGGLVSAFAGLFNANGNAFNAGAVVPFAKGGVPSSIVDAPTFFAMAGGRTGLMGEAGPEAIMPLHKDKDGSLAIKMLAANGEDYLLPLARDGSGKLSVRERVAQRFAAGGVFGAGITFPTAPRFDTSRVAALAVPIGGHQAQTNTTNVSVNVPQSTSQESASQIAARTATAIQRANRRNN